MDYIEHFNDHVFELTGFLSEEDCDQWIDLVEAEGFEPASINTQRGTERREDVRNNDRLIRDDPATAQRLWAKLGPYVSQVFRGRPVIGLNERFRFYRYDAGQKFDWHQDGSFERPNGERSLFTFLVYLNANFEGGGTSFSDYNSGSSFPDFCVKPKKGAALVFHHPIMHRGDPVVSGRKYVMRTDVMYAAKAL